MLDEFFLIFKYKLIMSNIKIIDIQFQISDEIGLQNKNQFLSLILDKPNVKAVVWGHVHHESETTLGSIQFLSAPSTCYQFQENKQSMSKNKPGYRKINLFKSGRLTTSVVRVDQLTLLL